LTAASSTVTNEHVGDSPNLSVTQIRRRSHLRRDYVYGTAFGLIAIIMLLPTTQGGWQLLLLWPGASFLIVAMAYLTGDVRYFGKRRDGTRHWLAGFALWPYLLLAKIVWSTQVALSRESATDVVNDRLVVSRRLRDAEFPADVTHVLDLTCEFVEPRATRRRLRFTCIPLLDAGAATPEALISEACALPPPEDGRLLVHCANGHGRTGMFAAVWLVAHGYATSATDAIQMLQSVRPAIALRRRQRDAVTEAVRLFRSSLMRSAEHVAAAESATRSPVLQQVEAVDQVREETDLLRPQSSHESHRKSEHIPWWAIAIMLLVFVQFLALTYFAFKSLGLVWYDFDGTFASWYALLVFAMVGSCLSAWLVMVLYVICKDFIAPAMANRRSTSRRLDGSDRVERVDN